jgi:hypothetical protein
VTRRSEERVRLAGSGGHDVWAAIAYGVHKPIR